GVVRCAQDCPTAAGVSSAGGAPVGAGVLRGPGLVEDEPHLAHVLARDVTRFGVLGPIVRGPAGEGYLVLAVRCVDGAQGSADSDTGRRAGGEERRPRGQALAGAG